MAGGGCSFQRQQKWEREEPPVLWKGCTGGGVHLGVHLRLATAGNNTPLLGGLLLEGRGAICAW